MIKKRLVGVITVKDGWAVQSFNYSRYLPLGRPEWLAENLDRWGVDEILVLAIDRSSRGLGPDLDLVKRIGGLGLSTPLAYGGGIHTAAHAAAVVKSGADRVCIDVVMRKDPSAVAAMAELVGAQAVIGALPLANADGTLQWRHYDTGAEYELSDGVLRLFTDHAVSEALIVDWRNEGVAGGFDASLVARFPIDIPLIAFGGISEPGQLAALLADSRVAACAVGNFLAYREQAVAQLKAALPALPIRPATYDSQP